MVRIIIQGEVGMSYNPSGGVVADAVAAARVRELLVSAQEPLIGWLSLEGCRRILVAMVRHLSGERQAADMLHWLAESENIQAVFRRIREFLANDQTKVDLVLDTSMDDCERVRMMLLRSAQQVTVWIEDERNTAQLLSALRNVGETVDMSVIVRRLENDAGSGYQLAQRAFQNIRLLMGSGRPHSGLEGLAGLAARASFV
ncbi:MAG: hypothetical protein AAB633_01120 [Patescibacteria group bacterium]